MTSQLLHTLTLSGEGYHPSPGSRTAAGMAGVDAGTSLLKLAVPRPAQTLEMRLYPSDAAEEATRFLREQGVTRVGAAGGRGRAFVEAFDGTVVNEFDAWAHGAQVLLSQLPVDDAPRYLLVSVGTGTSILVVDGDRVTRVGGTALGGGTLVGLCAELTGIRDFDQIVALAERGDRNAVDLLVSDVYPEDDSALLGAITAAHFGKLALGGTPRPRPADLAGAVMAMIGQNVGLLAMALAAASGTTRVVFGGSTLRNNPRLAGTLEIVTRALGREPVVLPHGEFAGAIGALHLASP